MKSPRFLSILLMLALATSIVPAQIGVSPCIGDDGFDTVCCAPVFPNLPAFPGFQMNGLYACLFNCNVEAQINTQVNLGAPQQVTCDYYLIPVQVFSTIALGPNINALLIAKYSRTWREIDPGTNVSRQVWRFLINTDANFMGGNMPCPVPPSVGFFGGNAHMVGHIDYAAECLPTPTVPIWSMAMSLVHATGCISHHPLSARPLAGPAAHPDRTYALVAPANFVFANNAPVMGPIVAEATRSSSLNLATGAYDCYGETDVLQGQWTQNFNDCFTCVAPVAGSPTIWHHGSFNAIAQCNGAIFPMGTIPVPGLFPTGMISLSIGNWVAGIGTPPFPGTRQLQVMYGAVQYQDPCNPGAFPFHAVAGVNTRSAALNVLFSGSATTANPSRMIDFSNMLLLNNGLTPGFGDIYYSSVVWNLNTP